MRSGSTNALTDPKSKCALILKVFYAHVFDLMKYGVLKV